jgi:DNA-binding transcriptional LysR family regulator
MDRIDALRIFIDIAEAGSFTAAARKHTFSTSTVTLALQRLEAEVGIRLITRTTRRLSLTHEGETFLADARRILADWDAVVHGLRDHGPLSGPIRITATNDFGRNFLVPMLNRFMRLHPQVQVSLLLSDANVNLVDQQLDLALRNGPLSDSGLKAKLLLSGPRVVCASPSYWSKNGKPEYPAQLAEHNCLILRMPEAPLAAWRFIVDGKPIAVKVSGDRSASDGGVLRQWAIDGFGVVLKNRWDVRSELESGLLDTALDSYIAEHVDLYAVYAGGRPSRRLARLIEFLSYELAADAQLAVVEHDWPGSLMKERLVPAAPARGLS